VTQTIRPAELVVGEFSNSSQTYADWGLRAPQQMTTRGSVIGSERQPKLSGLTSFGGS